VRVAPEGPEDDDPTPTLRGPHVAVVALLAAVALVLTGLVLWSSQPRAASVPLATQAAPTAGPDPTTDAGGALGGAPEPTPAPSPVVPAEVVVHVAGAVASPGVVVLAAGSRVVDAVQAAGGPLAGTSLDSVNLARRLVDGEQVRVGLAPDPALAAPTSAGSGPAPTGADAGASLTGVAPLDLNLATAAELDALPGIGPVLAQRVVDWREQNGAFASVEELLEVTGIGPSVLADLQDRVTV
jgi:competence protein ComEA